MDFKKNHSKYNTYYLLPWPECQEVQDTAPREFWSFTDADTHTGIFVEKNWFDSNRDKYGL